MKESLSIDLFPVYWKYSFIFSPLPKRHGKGLLCCTKFCDKITVSNNVAVSPSLFKSKHSDCFWGVYSGYINPKIGFHL